MSWTVIADGRQVTVALYQCLEDLQPLREKWHDLLETSSSDAAFVTWEWMYTWAEQFLTGDRRLFVLVVSEGPNVIGIAPCYLDWVTTGPLRIREIRFLGTPEAGSDYLDVISRRRKEKVIAHALLEVLTGELANSWDILALEEIPSDSPFLAHFITQLRWNGKLYSVEEGSFCPGIQLPETFDGYLGQLSSHCRQALRRKMRRLYANGSVEHVVLQGGCEAPTRLSEFRELHERRWGQPMDGLFGLLVAYTNRATRIDGWQTELSLLTIDGRAIAGLVHLTKGRRMLQYLMAVDKTFNAKLSIGTLMCSINIRAAIESGFSEYDFLKGEEDYKLRFMNRGRRSMNVCVPNKTLRSMSVWTLGAANALGKILLR